MDFGQRARRNAKNRRSGGWMAVVTLLIVSVAAVSLGTVPAPLAAEAESAPSPAEHQLAKPSSPKVAGSCAKAVFDSFEDDDVGGDPIASACFEIGESAATHHANVHQLASIASAWAHLARGPPSA